MSTPHMRHDLLYGNIKLFAGTASPELAQEIADYLGQPLCGRDILEFPNENLFIRLHESVRGQDCYVIQTTSAPVHRNLMELLILIQTLKLDSAGRITAVVPYLCYGRSDKKDKPRVPITAKLVADLLTTAGADRILTMDLHVGQIQGFFDIPVDNLYASPVMIPYISKNFNKELTIVSPDAGGVPRARAYAKRLEANLGLIDKRRDAPGKAKAMHLIGEVQDKEVVILDDIIDTAGTLTEAAKFIIQSGARNINACCTHAVLSGPALERVTNSQMNQLVVTDTIRLSEEALNCPKIVQLSVSHLLGRAIYNIHREDTISSLFEIHF